MPGRLPIRVLIAAGGSPDGLVKTLDSIAAANKPPGFLGVLVVENGPPCGVEAIVRRRDASERVAWRYSLPANKSLALNSALLALGDELLFFTDDDVELDHRVLDRLHEGALESPRRRYFGGALEVVFDGATHDDVGSSAPRSRTGWAPAFESLTEMPAGEFLGANWAAYADDLRGIGGFDPMFGPGSPIGSTGQESNAQRRLGAAGLGAVYVPDMVVRHRLTDDDFTHGAAVRRSFRHGVESALRRPASRRWASLPLIPFRLAANVGGACFRDAAGRRAAAIRRARLQGQIRGVLTSARLDALRGRYLASCAGAAFGVESFLDQESTARSRAA